MKDIAADKSTETKYLLSPEGNFKFKIKNGVLVNTYTQGLTYSNHLEFDRNIVVPTCVVELAKGAFSSLPVMNSIFLPSSIKKIQNGAFGKFSGDIILDDNFTAAINDNGVLYSPDKKRCLKATVRVNNLDITIPEGVEEICSNAFIQVNPKSIKLPKTLIKIENNAFGNFRCETIGIPTYDYNSFDIHIPENVRYIGKEAFQTHRISRITVSDKNKYFKTVDGALYTKNGKKLLHFPTEERNEFIIPKNTESIEKLAFSWCRINTIIIPLCEKLNLTSQQFNFSHIRKVILQEGHIHIPESAFYSCKFLEEVYIPATVTSIDDNAFTHCESMTIVAPKDSYAIQYAMKNNIQYRIV